MLQQPKLRVHNTCADDDLTKYRVGGPWSEDGYYTA